jgi:preprotein translocase subunit Sec61beta
MSDKPGYGFVASSNSSKKELPTQPKANPSAVSNNFFTFIESNQFTITVDPQAVLLVFLLVVLVVGIIRVSSPLRA